MKKKLCTALLVLVFAWAVTSLAFSQAQTAGTISGLVKDSTGAVVPGAEVVITNQLTGIKRSVVTDDSGFYTAPNVEVGVYSVSVSLPGFKTATAKDIKVDVRSNKVVNITLEVGEVTEQITVVGASASQVELRSGEVSNLIEAAQISELPLNGRSFVQLSLLVPGASLAQGANVRFTGLFAGVDISFSGSPSNANMWLVDGTNNVDIGSGRTILTYPSVDSIGEFKIQRNSYGADMAASSGAQINLVTKSGTNSFHGTFYEFHRNSALNATDFFINRAGQNKQPLIYNNFGYTIGGPVLKDKAFFFWSQEWRREGRGVPRQNLVPTELEKAGDFTGPNTRNYPDPLDPLTGKAFPGNKIPSNRLSPFGLAWMKLYPTPTLALTDPNFRGFNWVAAPTTPINTRQEQIRGDWVFSNNHSVMGRFTNDSWKNLSPSFIEGGLWGDDPFPAVDSDWNQPGYSLTTQWTATFGPSTINQFNFSWSGNRIIITRGAGEDINKAITSAIPEVFPGPEDRGHGTMWGDPLGNSLWHQPPWQNIQDLYVWKDDFSRVVGDHAFKTGFLISRDKKEEDINGNGTAYSPSFWSNGGQAIPGGAGIGGGWGPPNALGNKGIVTGNGVADLLLKGTYWGGGSENSTNPRSRVRWRDYEFYGADTWRVSPRLTLNYGFRWSYLPNPFDAAGGIGNFILSLYNPKEGKTPTNGMIHPGKIRGLDVDERALVKNHPFDIAPRFGFAFDPTGQGKWAIRGGVGMFYNREAISDVLGMSINPPFNTAIAWNCCRPFDALPTDDKFSGGEGVAQRGKDIQAKTPGSYQWNLTVERELWKDTKAEFGYVANRGHHVPTQLFLNQVPPDKRTQFAILQLDGDPKTSGHPLRPLFDLVGSGWGPLIYSRSADSWYHSFQAYLVKRFSNNLSYQVAYTFSKLLSTAYGLGHVGGNEISDPTNIKYDKGLASFDKPHIFTSNVIYRTSGLEGQNPFVRTILGDWETAIIFTANSGRPEGVPCDGCRDFTGTRSIRLDLIGNPKGPKTVDQWFNTAAFVPPDVAGRLGKSARTQYRGPGINNWDLSIMKNFPGLPWWSQEGATVQFRAEFFNAFNHTQFRFVNNSFSISNPRVDTKTGKLIEFKQTNTNFGKVSRMREPREIQFGLKIIW